MMVVAPSWQPISRATLLSEPFSTVCLPFLFTLLTLRLTSITNYRLSCYCSTLMPFMTCLPYEINMLCDSLTRTIKQNDSGKDGRRQKVKRLEQCPSLHAWC